VRSRVSWVCALGAVLIASIGCREPRRPIVHGVRDSAGTRVVTSTTPRLSADSAWTVDSVASLMIGPESVPAGVKPAAAEPYVFNHVVAAMRTREGGVAVVDRRWGQLRFFDERGRFIRAVGRKGQGPGEFAVITGGLRVADGFLITNSGGLSAVFGESGQLVRSVPTTNRRPFAALEDGSLLAYEYASSPTMSFGGGTAPSTSSSKGVDTHREALVILSSDGPVKTPLGLFPAHLALSKPDVVRGIMLAFSPLGLFTASGGRVYTMFGDVAEVQGRDTSGQVVQIARWPIAGLPLDAATKEEYRRQSYLFNGKPSTNSLHLEMVRATLEAMTYPDTLPRAADLIADLEGNLWVRHHVAECAGCAGDLHATSGPLTWSVLDRDGVWITDVVTPAMKVLEIGRDYLIGTTMDADGQFSVKMHRLRR
jgi:hypothetical protein